MEYDKLPEETRKALPRADWEALKAVWEDPVSKKALERLLGSFRVPAVSVCQQVIPDSETKTRVIAGRQVFDPPGVLSIARAQGKIQVLDAVWNLLGDLFKEREVENAPQEEEQKE